MVNNESPLKWRAIILIRGCSTIYVSAKPEGTLEIVSKTPERTLELVGDPTNNSDCRSVRAAMSIRFMGPLASIIFDRSPI